MQQTQGAPRTSHARRQQRLKAGGQGSVQVGLALRLLRQRAHCLHTMSMRAEGGMNGSIPNGRGAWLGGWALLPAGSKPIELRGGGLFPPLEGTAL